MRKVYAGILAAMLLILPGCSGTGAAPQEVNSSFSERAYVAYNGTYQPGEAPEGMELAAQKGYMAMFFDSDTANFVLEDMRTGERYHSISPTGKGTARERSHLLVTHVDRESDSMKTRYSANATIQAKKTDTGFQVWYVFQEEKYAIPVEYSLCEDGLRVRIRADQIKEQDENLQLFTVSILPFFYAQSEESDGFMMVPDGSGAIIKMDQDKTNFSTYNASLYGDLYLAPADYESSVTEDCILPFAGLQGQKGGFLAMAENGLANANIEAAAKDQDSSYAHLYYTYELRRRHDATIGDALSSSARTVVVYEEGPIRVKDISVRYFVLDSNPTNGLSKMAEVARNVVADQAGTLTGAAESAMYLSTLGGFTTTRSVVGFQMQVTQPVTTFQAASEMLTKLTSAGVNDISLIYNGYNRDMLRGELTDALNPDGKVGSLEELTELTQQLGKQKLLLDYNPVELRTNGNGLSTGRSVVRDLNKSIITLYPYKRNTFHADRGRSYYLLKTNLVTDLLQQATQWQTDKAADAGLLLSGVSEKLYADYSENGYSREQMLTAVSTTLKELSGKSALYVKGAYYGAAVYASAIIDVPDSSSGYDIFDESVPFYQMVFSGSKQLVSRPINQSGNSEQAFLNCIRFGLTPHYELIADKLELPGTYGIDSFRAAAYADWGEEVAKRYKEYLPIYEAIKGRSLLDYQTVGEKVYRLTYSDGVEVIVNQSEETVQVAGQALEPSSFALLQ